LKIVVLFTEYFHAAEDAASGLNNQGRPYCFGGHMQTEIWRPLSLCGPPQSDQCQLKDHAVVTTDM